MIEHLPPEFWLGVEQFNQSEYYACHDTLEAIWMEAAEPEKTFCQGILQIAVSLYHLHNYNWQGAVTLLGEGIYRLRRYQPDYMGVNVADLLQHSQKLLDALQQTGAEQVAAVVEQLAPTNRDISKQPFLIQRSSQ